MDDITETKNSINSLIRQANAYVSSYKEDEYNEGPQYETVVRVPSSQLDDFIDKLEPLARKMKSKSLSSQDVTDEYVDISARITTKRELEKHYREILRKATKVSEMLEVEQQLEIVRGEIESMEARIEYINNHTDYSIVTITYYQHVISTDGESFSQKVAISFRHRVVWLACICCCNVVGMAAVDLRSRCSLDLYPAGKKVAAISTTANQQSLKVTSSETPR